MYCGWPSHAVLQDGSGKKYNLRSTEHEDCRSDLYRSFTREAIGDKGRYQSSDEGTRWHGSRDSTLCTRDRVVEVVLIGTGAEDTAHGTDVESEEHAAYSEVSVKRAHEELDCLPSAAKPQMA